MGTKQAVLKKYVSINTDWKILYIEDTTRIGILFNWMLIPGSDQDCIEYIKDIYHIKIRSSSQAVTSLAIL